MSYVPLVWLAPPTETRDMSQRASDPVLRLASRDSGSSASLRAPRPGGRVPLSPWVALIVVWMVWGSTYLAIRVADRTIPPLEMAAARYLIAGALLFPVARLRGCRTAALHCRMPSLAQWAGMTLVGTMLLAVGNGGVSYAEQTLPSGLAALLVASVPLWVVLAERAINRRRISLARWLAVVIGLVGVAVLAQRRGHGACFRS